MYKIKNIDIEFNLPCNNIRELMDYIKNKIDKYKNIYVNEINNILKRFDDNKLTSLINNINSIENISLYIKRIYTNFIYYSIKDKLSINKKLLIESVNNIDESIDTLDKYIEYKFSTDVYIDILDNIVLEKLINYDRDIKDYYTSFEEYSIYMNCPDDRFTDEEALIVFDILKKLEYKIYDEFNYLRRYINNLKTYIIENI